MEDRGKDRRFGFGVTGSPVLHSKSPLMFNEVFHSQSKTFGPGYSYSRIAAGTAKEAIYLFNQLGLTGMNVTSPFKKDIMKELELVDDAAIRIGGVNTVVRQDKGLVGYNTDYAGVAESFKQRGIPLAKLQIVVLGAGSAGRAAAYGLAREGAEVIIVNRTYSKAVDAAKTIGCRAEDIGTLETLLKSADALVSSLSADVDLIWKSWLKKELVVLDANYKRSPLLEKAKKAGCTVIKGEEWLLNQAVPAFRYFTGIDPNPDAVEAMRKSILTPRGEKPKNIALVGFMASGKSMIGKLLANEMGMRFKDTDGLIEEKEGCFISEIFENKGEAYFRKKETEILERELETERGVIYSCGGGVVLDERNKGCLKKNALVIWLYSSIPTTLKRLEPGTRPLLEHDDSESEARRLLQMRLPHYTECADLIVANEAGTIEVAQKIHDEIDKTFGY
ncbi:MAG: NAD(P)-binding domain-containing protein [bacterium]|nr:NAD(P)-binding domain-containing protein [bacterium]